jgi:protein-S-isoprenylcysteine O-methyltransferase Ste14
LEISVTQPTWLQRWQKVARRIRVPLGFVAALLYLWELVRHRPQPAPIFWSLLLVLPGLWLRSYAAGYVKKNRELTVTGPYAHTRNPLYLGSMLMAAGFAVALMSWPFALVLVVGFTVIYVPVIASEEAFLRATFPNFNQYCARVPRLIPRLTPGVLPGQEATSASGGSPSGSFSFALYRRHREYNSAIGAVLLYVSLLLGILGHTMWGH